MSLFYIYLLGLNSLQVGEELIFNFKIQTILSQSLGCPTNPLHPNLSSKTRQINMLNLIEQFFYS